MVSLDRTFCSNGDCPKKKDCGRSLDNLKLNVKRYLSVSHFDYDESNNECKHFYLLEDKNEKHRNGKNGRR